MKIFTLFTKDGRVDVPLKDNQIPAAAQIMKNPDASIMDKVREMNDLSNKLTKAQLHDLESQIEKVEFTDVDGRTIRLVKDAGNAIQVIGKDEVAPEVPHNPEDKAEFDKEKKEHPEFTDEQIWQIVADHKRADMGKSATVLRNAAGKLQKGGPGSGRHDEGGRKPYDGQDVSDVPTVIPRTEPKTFKIPPMPKDKGNPKAPFEDIDDWGKPTRTPNLGADKDVISSPKEPKATAGKTWSAPVQDKPAPKAPEKAPGADDKKIATEHVKANVPWKHQDQAKAYLNSEQFHQDVARHSENRQKEIENLGYAQGPHPAVRAMNEHMHPLMTKADYQDFMRNTAGWLAKQE